MYICTLGTVDKEIIISLLEYDLLGHLKQMGYTFRETYCSFHFCFLFAMGVNARTCSPWNKIFPLKEIFFRERYLVELSGSNRLGTMKNSSSQR